MITIKEKFYEHRVFIHNNNGKIETYTGWVWEIHVPGDKGGRDYIEIKHSKESAGERASDIHQAIEQGSGFKMTPVRGFVFLD